MLKGATKEEQFEAFIRARNDLGDWADFMSLDRTALVRQKIIDQCGFTRSTLYQNAKIKARLIEVEARLRVARTLRSETATIANELMEEPAILHATMEIELKIDRLQQRLATLSSSIDEVQSRAKMGKKG